MKLYEIEFTQDFTRDVKIGSTEIDFPQIDVPQPQSLNPYSRIKNNRHLPSNY